jgi:hypothetical protein
MALLTKDEYLATFVEPMRRLEADEPYKLIPIGDYVAGCVRMLEPPVALERLQIHHSAMC